MLLCTHRWDKTQDEHSRKLALLLYSEVYGGSLVHCMASTASTLFYLNTTPKPSPRWWRRSWRLMGYESGNQSQKKMQMKWEVLGNREQEEVAEVDRASHGAGGTATHWGGGKEGSNLSLMVCWVTITSKSDSIIPHASCTAWHRRFSASGLIFSIF